MSYYRKRSYRPAKPQPRAITVKYAGRCTCCLAPIKAGETAMYYPPGTILNQTEGKIAHIGGIDGNSAVCSFNIGQAMNARETAAVSDYAGDGLDARYEDQCADICGR